MKKNMMKLGVIAALVMGASSMAHAATQAKVAFSGLISAQTCNISVNNSTVGLGNWTVADFPSVGSEQAGTGTATLTISACGSVPANQSVVLTAVEPLIDTTVQTAKLWGEENIGVGVHLTSKVGTAAAADFTPTIGTAGLKVASNTGSNPASLTPDPVLITPVSRAYAAAKAGNIAANLIFNASVQ